MRKSAYKKTTMGKYITDYYTKKEIKKMTNRKLRKNVKLFTEN